jgi:2-polyprenyl-3-methyl-5-hydroxy-6-metoxy-1,4-benzoquinol methylase
MQPYTANFFDQLQAGALRSARAVVPYLLNLLRPVSVIDVGCGRGAWLAVFREQGVQDVLGIDGRWECRRP